MDNQKESICKNCKNYTGPSMKFLVRANETRPYVEKDFIFDKRCIFGYKERIRDAIILECSEFKKED
jgi:hypothetical protein